MSLTVAVFTLMLCLAADAPVPSDLDEAIIPPPPDVMAADGDYDAFESGTAAAAARLRDNSAIDAPDLLEGFGPVPSTEPEVETPAQDMDDSAVDESPATDLVEVIPAPQPASTEETTGEPALHGSLLDTSDTASIGNPPGDAKDEVKGFDLLEAIKALLAPFAGRENATDPANVDEIPIIPEQQSDPEACLPDESIRDVSANPSNAADNCDNTAEPNVSADAIDDDQDSKPLEPLIDEDVHVLPSAEPNAVDVPSAPREDEGNLPIDSVLQSMELCLL